MAERVLDMDKGEVLRVLREFDEVWLGVRE